MGVRSVAVAAGSCIGFLAAAGAAVASPVNIDSDGGAKSAPVTRDSSAVACVDGIADGYPCNNIDLMSFMPLAEIGGGSGNDIWGWTDNLSGREYALMGRSNGTAFIDITDPEHPEYLGNLPTQTTNSAWRDIKTYNDHAFIVSEASGHGMQIFDLRQLRNAGATPATFTATNVYDGFGSAHNIVINTATGYAYAVGTRNSDDGCAGGLHMVNIANLTSPSFAGCYSGDGYTHDAQCVIYSGPDPDWNVPGTPREICFNYNEDTLTIVDVTDKSAPQMIARRGYAGRGYTHQGWISEDQERLLLNDEGDETATGNNTRTYIWNIKDLDDPRLSMTYDGPVESIDHNLYIKDDFAFQANYRSGLRILDLSNADAGIVSENAFFDIYPSSDAAAFNGAWSVFPYFDSGNVVVSGIEQGLYVLRPTALAAPFTISAAAANLDFCGNGSGSVPIALEGRPGFSASVNVSVAGMPPGMLASVAPVEVVPPAALTLDVVVNDVVPGVYPISLSGSDGIDTFSVSLTVSVSADQPGAATLSTPANGAGAISVFQPVYWSPALDAFSYDVEVATDAAFANVVAATSSISANSFTPPGGLVTGTEYYWRVRARNACGATLSSSSTFTTAAESCSVTSAQDGPYNIDGSSTPTIVSTLVTSVGGLVTDVNVLDVNGVHTYVGDLQFRLEGPLNEEQESSGGPSRHPQRATVTLMDRVCGSADNFDLGFDDQATAAVPCPPTGGGNYQPKAPLAEFNGVSGTGDWRLYVADNFPQDGGRLDGWSVELCAVPAVLVPDSDNDGISDSVDNCTAVANPDQRDTDADGYGNACDADLNNDGIVNVVDLGVLRSVFFGTDTHADFDGDGNVNAVDLGILRQQFFGPPGPSGVAN